MSLRKWGERQGYGNDSALSPSGLFCTVSKPSLTVLLLLVLAEVQIDRPTQSVAGSVGLG